MSFIQRFFKKAPEELEVQDVQNFIYKKIEENVNLDYKDISLIEDTEKLSKHVCAFANTEGGLLILGVREAISSVGKKKQRIYPGTITWVNHSYSREQLEEKLKTKIDPPVSLKIVPIRKSREDPKLIFLLDIPESNELHMHKNTHRFYKRLNFESVPMEREEIINFIKIRLRYERCAWFRFHLNAVLVDFMDGVLVRLNPQYAKTRYFDPRKISKKFENFITLPVEKIIDVVKQVTIRDLLRFDMEISDIAADLGKINTYPHEDITPEERVLFDSVKDQATQLSWNLEEFCEKDASWHKIGNDWRSLSCIEFARATKHEEHFLHRLSSYVRSLVWFSREILKLKRMLDELQRKYGEFKSCKVVQNIYDWSKKK